MKTCLLPMLIAFTVFSMLSININYINYHMHTILIRRIIDIQFTNELSNLSPMIDKSFQFY